MSDSSDNQPTLMTSPTRRRLMAGTLATSLSGLVHGQAFGFKPNQRYPDPAVEILDPSFAKYRIFSASVEQLSSDMRWAEGPVWIGDGRYLLVSDIPNNRIVRWDESHRPQQRLPPAFEFLERAGAGSAGTASDLRTPHTPGHAHRIRRLDHRAGRQLRGQAAQLAQRHRLQVRRLDLVHRSALRHRRAL